MEDMKKANCTYGGSTSKKFKLKSQKSRGSGGNNAKRMVEAEEATIKRREAEERAVKEKEAKKSCLEEEEGRGRSSEGKEGRRRGVERCRGV